MSRSINRVELLGHLGQDADVKYTPSGIQVASLSIATSRRWKPANSDEWKEETDWHKCILWRCEKVAGFLTKGKQLYVTGRMQTRSYEDRDGVKRYITETVIDELILLGGGNGEGGGPQQQQRRTTSAPRTGANAPSSSQGPDDMGEHGVTEDDVPF